jgi:hypothetical protein
MGNMVAVEASRTDGRQRHGAHNISAFGSHCGDPMCFLSSHCRPFMSRVAPWRAGVAVLGRPGNKAGL